ncbi:probable serine/threonine-protein kinase DDB_G0282963 [Nasonia vitripennis]|uniref:LisH domain-containing protein n=1 Tax=Nasonia vitripennis TaxID=7425 RepID=A0A7M7QJF1_NASVI|nr:probable serine/threonine-protein kinase DDB_G0282963 [Nasonia vitripennis]
MMALEALLPSEVARLVYGYLLDERCTETAQSLLNESTNLLECRRVVSRGKTFTTRVGGHTLKTILDNFCAVNSIVQDKVSKIDNLDELNQCYDFVDIIKFFLEDYKKQTTIVKVDASTQVTPSKPSESLEKLQKTCSCFSTNEGQPTQRVVQRFDKEAQTETSFYEPSAVEATPLQDLPGYIGHSENGKFQTKRTKNEIQKVNVHEKQNEEISPETSKQYANSEVQTSTTQKSERFDKNVMTDIVEKPLNNCVDTEVQTSEIGSPDSGVPPSSVEILGDITLELLNRTEVQEKIAENINRVLGSKKSVYFSNKPSEGTKEEASKSFIAKLNKTVQTALNKTENDPELLDLLNEFIQPVDEIMSTEDEADMEVDNVDIFQENMDLDFGDAISNLKNKETVLAANGQNPAKIIIEQNHSDETHNTVSAENNPTQVEFVPTHITKNIVNQVLLENRQSQNKILGEQNISDGTYTTSAHSNVITASQAEYDPTHSTKCIANQAIVKVPSNTQNNLETIVSSSLSSAESQALQQKPVPTSDNFFTQNNTITSTPLKTYTAVQGFDPCDWFSTEALLTPDIDYHKHSVFKNPYTACETVVPTTTLISPIASKDTTNIAEKVTSINCSTANAIKNRTLNTPDVTFPPKSNFPSSTNPVFPIKLSLSKDSENQISPEIKNNLPGLHSMQKVNRIADNNNSSSLSNEKLFGSESIILYGMENNATTVPTLVTIPEIEVEDSITLTGIGLSPFIKINKTSKDTKLEKSDPVANHAILYGRPSESNIAVTLENQKISESTLKRNACTTEVVTKSTPKILKENRSKNNRLSLSTPKKPSSHVRALNFETPIPRSKSESKANEKTTGRSPDSIMKELKNACKSSLFQSPEITNVEIIEQNDLPSDNGGENVDLKNLKGETIVNHNEAKKQAIAINENVSCKPDAIKVEGKKKKSWDEDLRTMIGQATEAVKEPSKKSKKKKKSKDTEKGNDKIDSKISIKQNKSTPKKSKKSFKKTPKKSKKNNKSEASNDAKNVNTEKTKIDIEKPEEMIPLPNSIEDMPVVLNESEEIHIPLNNSEITSVGQNNSEKTPIVPKNLEEMPVLTKSSKETSILPNSSEVTPMIPNGPKDEITKTTNDGILSNSSLEALLSNSINDDNAVGITDVMKLAAEELDNLSKLNHNDSVSNIVGGTNHDIVEKMQHDEELMTAAFENRTENISSNCLKEKEIESIDNKIVKPDDVKNFVDYKKLDTQLNIEELNVTPPFTNNSIIASISSGSSQKAEVIYDRVSKIERGRIVQKKYARLHTLDTKIASKSSLNNFSMEIKTPLKDEETPSLQVPPTPRVLSPGNSCSFLSMPTSKLGDESRKIRCFVTTPVECPLTPEIVLTPPKTQDENTAEGLKNGQKTGTSSYFQPTFEAFKNSEITQFEVIKENLKGSTPKTQSESEKTINDAPKDQSKFEPFNDNPKLLSEIGAIPRHQQNTISSSSCSSATCSSCSSSVESYTNNNNDNEYNDNGNNGPDVPSPNIPINIDEQKSNIQTSPEKLFSIKKTDEELADTIKETPVKDDNAYPEMGIVDTPNVSKPAENPTNLNAKISQMMIMKEKEQMEMQQVADKQKPKIISVEHVMPRIITKPSSQFIKALPLSMQRQAYEIQNEFLHRNPQFQRVKIEKTEKEVAQAVESITVKSDFKFNKSLEKSAGSITLSPIEKPDLDNTPHKIELVKAVKSITDGDIDSPLYSPVKTAVCGDDEETCSIQSNNSKIEHCTSSDHSLNSSMSKPKVRVSDISTKWSDRNATCREIHMVFDDSDYSRKRRRKKVNEEELVQEYCLDHGHVLHYYKFRPTTFECMYNQVPPRIRKKKETLARTQFEYVKTDSQESTSTTSSAVLSGVSHNERDEEKRNINRKRTIEPEQRTIYNKKIKSLTFSQF